MFLSMKKLTLSNSSSWPPSWRPSILAIFPGYSGPRLWMAGTSPAMTCFSEWTLARGHWPLKHQRAPWPVAAGLAQDQALRAVEARHQILLPVQQARQDHDPAARERPGDLRRQPRQRLGEDV